MKKQQGINLQEYPIEKTRLSVRVKNCLRRANIIYVSQLLDLTEQELSKFRNMGARSIHEVLELQKRCLKKTDEFLCFSGDDKIPYPITPEYLVIEMVFPETIGKSKDCICFRQKNGTLVSDINIDNIEAFSVRIKNGIHRAGLSSIKAVAMMEESVLRRIHNMGAKSISEIYEFLKHNTEIESKEAMVFTLADKIYIDVLNAVSKEKPTLDYGFLLGEIKQIISQNIELLRQLGIEGKTVIETGLFKDLIGKSEAIQKAFANYFYSVIESCLGYVEIDDLKTRIPSTINSDGFFQSVIALLTEAKRIERFKNGYRKILPHIEDWVNSLNGNAKIVVSMRLENKTLEECGRILGVTRERARQIFSTAVKRKPILREDDYAYWYQTYALDEDAMKYMFGTTSDIYSYFRAVYRYGGKRPICEMTSDGNMTSEIYSGYMRYENRNNITIGEECVPINKELLCRKLAQNVCSKNEIGIDEFYSLYLQLLKEQGLSNNEKLLFSSVRSFESRLQDSMYVLYKYGRRLRYYPIHEYDIEDLVAGLHLEQYRDIEISARKLFVDNSELMAEYDIHDEYELHNLLNKTKDIWNCENSYNVKFRRMPFLAFGNTDRVKQTEWLLLQVAPVTYEEFGEFYEMEFGVRASTALANMAPLISKYYHDGVFSVNQPLLSLDEQAYMKEQLLGDFHFITDVQAIYTAKYGSVNISRLNPRTYKELGFRVFSNYLVNNRFSTADHYFTYLFTREPLLDMSRFDARLCYVHSATQALHSLRKQYDILEYEDKKYISFSHFRSVLEGLSKDDLQQYVEDAIAASGDDKFFTIRSLKRKGFSSKLHNVGFGDWFNAALLKNSKMIRYIKTTSGIIFGKEDRQLTLLDFLIYILKKVRKIDIYNLIETIEQEYGVSLRRDKITFVIKESELYFDPIMEKIYLSKELYYEDLEML